MISIIIYIYIYDIPFSPAAETAPQPRIWCSESLSSHGSSSLEEFLLVGLVPMNSWDMSWLRGVFLVQMELPARCSGCRRPLTGRLLIPPERSIHRLAGYVMSGLSLALKGGSVKGDPNCTRNSFVIPGHPVANTTKGWNLYVFWDWWWILGIKTWFIWMFYLNGWYLNDNKLPGYLCENTWTSCEDTWTFCEKTWASCKNAWIQWFLTIKVPTMEVKRPYRWWASLFHASGDCQAARSDWEGRANNNNNNNNNNIHHDDTTNNNTNDSNNNTTNNNTNHTTTKHTIINNDTHNNTTTKHNKQTILLLLLLLIIIIIPILMHYRYKNN